MNGDDRPTQGETPDVPASLVLAIVVLVVVGAIASFLVGPWIFLK